MDLFVKWGPPQRETLFLPSTSERRKFSHLIGGFSRNKIKVLKLKCQNHSRKQVRDTKAKPSDLHEIKLRQNSFKMNIMIIFLI